VLFVRLAGALNRELDKYLQNEHGRLFRLNPTFNVKTIFGFAARNERYKGIKRE